GLHALHGRLSLRQTAMLTGTSLHGERSSVICADHSRRSRGVRAEVSMPGKDTISTVGTGAGVVSLCDPQAAPTRRASASRGAHRNGRIGPPFSTSEPSFIRNRRPPSAQLLALSPLEVLRPSWWRARRERAELGAGGRAD